MAFSVKTPGVEMMPAGRALLAKNLLEYFSVASARPMVRTEIPFTMPFTIRANGNPGRAYGT